MAAVAAGLFCLGAGTALATQSGSIEKLHSGGVEFLEGEFRFNPPGTNHGAFEWSGVLHDNAADDGHNVYMQVRVEGHGWVRYNGKQRHSVSMHHFNWDGAQRYTSSAKLRACRDRGSLHPDNCSKTKSVSHHRD
ncbi:hypothetical protein KMS84_07085 [Streptomyces sp. IBSBF 2807]|nr:hypothetical protein [Streptomyces hilarionis]